MSDLNNEKYYGAFVRVYDPDGFDNSSQTIGFHEFAVVQFGEAGHANLAL
ncbi:MAG: hypothetical protein ABGX16_08550 [Pirellulales bacterium]